MHISGVPGPTGPQLEIVARARRLAKVLAEGAVESDRDATLSLESFAALRGSGLCSFPIPTEYGGEGASLFETVLAQEVLAAADPSVALIYGQLMNVVGFERDSRNWPAEVFEQVCRDIIVTGGLINNCAAEPGLGSINRGAIPAMIGVPVRGGWEISGRKIFVTGGPVLRYLITAIRLPPSDAAPEGTMARAVVRSDSPGLRIEDAWTNSLSLRACGNSDAIYDRVFVPDELVVERNPIRNGVTGRRGVNAWQIGLATVFLGIGQAALDDACQYARRHATAASQQPIAEKPQVQQWIGEMEVKLTTARAMLHDTTRAWSDHPAMRSSMAPRIDMAKYVCTHVASEVTHLAMRVGGAASLTRELPFERHVRNAEAGLVLWPFDDMVLTSVGRAVLGGASGTHVP